MDPIPNTQYRPICVIVKHVVVTPLNTFRRHLNLRKIDWNGYSTEELDKLIENLDHMLGNYNRFVEKVHVVSNIYIPI